MLSGGHMSRASFDMGKERMSPQVRHLEAVVGSLVRHLVLNLCCGAVLPVPVQVEKSQAQDECGRREITVKGEDFSDFCSYCTKHKYNCLAAYTTEALIFVEVLINSYCIKFRTYLFTFCK